MSGPLLDWHPLVSLSHGFDVCSNLSLLTCFLVFVSKSEKTHIFQSFEVQICEWHWFLGMPFWIQCFCFATSVSTRINDISIYRCFFFCHVQRSKHSPWLGFIAKSIPDTVFWFTERLVCVHNQSTISIALVCRTWFYYSQYSPPLKTATLVIHIFCDYMGTTLYGWK